MAQHRPVTGHPDTAEMGADILSTGRPLVDTLPSFEAFYLGEIAGLVTLAAGLCGRAQAEDVAQEAMLATYRRWREVSRRDHPAAFARRVCANLAVSAFRRRLVEIRAVVRLTDRTWTQGRQDVVGPTGVDDEFWGRVCGLPRRQAQCIALRYVYGLDVADIARTLAISEGSAKVHLFRGRHTLAERLGIEQEEDR
jgi:DNA-directed RNA polymerase specialized sigma24 family protein